MSEVVNIADRSAAVLQFSTLTDPQVLTLARVLGANVNYGLREVAEAGKWSGNPCVDYYAWPVTASLLTDVRLPSLSVWRESTSVVYAKKARERRARFAIRYWLDATGREWLPVMWGALQGAYEVIARTLTGNSLIDLSVPGPNGPRAIPSSDLLCAAGFSHIDENSIRGTTDFAVAGNQLYPVLEVTFEAEHDAAFGGLPYSCEFPNGVTLEELNIFTASIWEAGQGAVEDPLVVVRSVAEGASQTVNVTDEGISVTDGGIQVTTQLAV
jgi:hypothetical protein